MCEFFGFMRQRGFYLSILAVLFVGWLSSCSSSSSTTTTLSSVAQITAFSLANDSFPTLAKAAFAVEERLDTGLIYNKDSLDYGVRIDSVLMKVTYAASPSSASLHIADTIMTYVYTDTVNLTEGPIYFTIISQDNNVVKTYEIRVTVHQVDPDLFSWEEIPPSEVPEVEPLPAAPASLPDGLTAFYGPMFKLGTDYWGIGERNDSMLLSGYSSDWNHIYIPLPDNSPVTDWCAITFAAASNRERAMIIGGYDVDGFMSRARLNFEYSLNIPADGHIRVVDYAASHPEMEPLAGVAVVWYNHKLYRFGGIQEDDSYFSSPIYESKDEGMTWQVPDSAKNMLPETIGPRQKMTVLVDESYIYIIGGKDETKTYTDCYRGKVNSIDW